MQHHPYDLPPEVARFLTDVRTPRPSRQPPFLLEGRWRDDDRKLSTLEDQRKLLIAQRWSAASYKILDFHESARAATNWEYQQLANVEENHRKRFGGDLGDALVDLDLTLMRKGDRVEAFKMEDHLMHMFKPFGEG